MTKQKRLNIHNTNKVFNLDFMYRGKEEFTLVTSITSDNIKKDIQEVKKQDSLLKIRDNKSYIVYTDLLQDDELVRNLFEYGGYVTYYAEGVVPYHIIKLLNENRKNSRAMIPLKSGYTFREAQNIAHASMSSTVVLDVPVVYSETNHLKLIVGMSDLRYRVDRLELVFPPLTIEEISIKPSLKKYYQKRGEQGLYYLKSHLKYEYFTRIRNACSHWKINIVMIADNSEDLRLLENMKNKDKANRKGSSTW